jgi:hypothetical protein
MKKNKLFGYIMAGVGFALIVLNALSYILYWSTKSSVLSILGIVFLVIGLKTARKTKK